MGNQAKNVLGAEDLIRLLLKEPKILQKVILSLKPQARNYTEVKVELENERIYFGKYCWSDFFGNFWNNLIKCCDHISLDDFYIKTWDALVEMTAGTESNEAVIEGLSREVLLQGIHNKDQNILQRFFDVCRHLTLDGYWRDKGLNSDNPVHHHTKSQQNSGASVEVEIPQPGYTREYHVYGHDGSEFEVVNVRWIGGRR
jgi:hypothetical protein